MEQWRGVCNKMVCEDRGSDCGNWPILVGKKRMFSNLLRKYMTDE